MGTVQSSGAISLNDVKNALGGPASPSLSDYYRGGTYVKPQTNEAFIANYQWQQSGSFIAIFFNGFIVNNVNVGTATSYTYGGVTYYRGTYQYTSGDGYVSTDHYAISKGINTGVPSSGGISLSNLYGATTP